MKSLKLAGFFALSVLSCRVTHRPAGEVVWWTPNWGEERARTLAQKFMAANPGITIKIEVTVSDGLPAARAHRHCGPARRPTSSKSSTAG